MKYLPDVINTGLTVLFIGFNPSLRSAEVGHHFAGKSNRFWKILHLAGLTDGLLSYKEDKELLFYKFGLTNIVERPTKTAAEITKDEYRFGREILRNKIIYYKPEILVFVGAGVYKAYAGKDKAAWGFQPRVQLEGTREFVAPSTSGLVRMRLAEQVAIYQELTRALVCGD